MKGQAMVEALIASLVIFSFLFLGIKLSDLLLKKLALENFAEEFLICKKTLSVNCESEFDFNLKSLNLSEIKYKYENQNLDIKDVTYSLKP